MLLSIIILNYKSKGLVRQCLKAIYSLGLSFDFETIVVDNASNDNIFEMLENNFPQVKFIAASKNSGYAAGNNLGIKKSIGEYILILNPDIIAKPGSIEKMVDYLKQHKEAGIVAPKLINPDKSVQFSCYEFPKFWVPLLRRTPLGKIKKFKKNIEQYLMSNWDHNSIKEVDWVLGAAIMFRKKDLDKIGLLDERFILYFDDIDFCRRFWDNDLKVVYLAPSEMIHYHQRMSAEDSLLKALFNRVTRIHIQSWVKYFWKYRGRK